MSKITRTELNELCPYNSVNANDRLFERIEQREEDFSALVDAVSHAHKIQSEPPDVEKAMLALAAVFKAHRELIPPPPSPADRLDSIGDFLRNTGLANKGDEVIAIAAELREGEG